MLKSFSFKIGYMQFSAERSSNGRFFKLSWYEIPFEHYSFAEPQALYTLREVFNRANQLKEYYGKYNT